MRWVNGHDNGVTIVTARSLRRHHVVVVSVKESGRGWEEGKGQGEWSWQWHDDCDDTIVTLSSSPHCCCRRKGLQERVGRGQGPG